MPRQDDPRLRPLIDATTALLVEANYDPHFANIAERLFYENLLFLARYDALVKFYNEQVVEPNKIVESFRKAYPTVVIDNPSGDKIPIYAAESKPVDMILFCPNCGLQHIDAPSDVEDCRLSHTCGYCNYTFRPSDVPTNGVPAILTAGKADHQPPLRQVKPLDRFRPQWQHVKRGTVYRELGRGELQFNGYPNEGLLEGARLVAYQGEDNRIWFRLESEFEDGRFTKI